jgi:hypothetical protein
MKQIHIPSDEEIRAAYRQGEEAVIALIHQTVGQLAVRVQALEDWVSKNSRNSGKPPSMMGWPNRRRRACGNGTEKRAAVSQGMRDTC